MMKTQNNYLNAKRLDILNFKSYVFTDNNKKYYILNNILFLKTNYDKIP